MEIYKIVLEGPPHSGKSSVFTRLKKRAAAYPIVFLDEVATEILRADPEFPIRNKTAFQKEVLCRQKAGEDALAQELRKTHPNEPFGVQILDRAAADLYVYLDRERADRVCEEGLTALLSRYTLVIHFDAYHSGKIKAGNQNRIENDRAEIEALASQSEAVWGQHTHFISVSPKGTIEEKTATVTKIINEFFQSELFRQQ